MKCLLIQTPEVGNSDIHQHFPWQKKDGTNNYADAFLKAGLTLSFCQMLELHRKISNITVGGKQFEDICTR